jgi:hypothetical protein
MNCMLPTRGSVRPFSRLAGVHDVTYWQREGATGEMGGGRRGEG